MNIFKVLGTAPTPKTIYIGLMGGVGDLVVAAPTISALKKKFPEAHLTLGVQPGIYYDIVANDPHIDQFDTLFIKWPPTKSLRKQFANRKDLLIKNARYDMVRFLDGIAEQNINWQKGGHMIEHFAEFCGVEVSKRRAIVYLNNKDVFQGEKIIKKTGVGEGDPFIVIAPNTGSKRARKEWPYDNFVELTKRIKNKFKIKILTIITPDSIKDYPGTVIIKGTQTIREAAAIIAKSCLYIGCDSGLTHIASAFNTPIISIHIGHSTELHGALSPDVTFISGKPFLPRDEKKDPPFTPETISVDRVFEAVIEKLRYPNLPQQ